MTLRTGQRLNRKFLTGLIPSLVAVFMLAGAVIALLQYRFLSASLDNKADRTARLASIVLEKPVWDLDADQVAKVLEALRQDPEIRAVTVTDQAAPAGVRPGPASLHPGEVVRRLPITEPGRPEVKLGEVELWMSRQVIAQRIRDELLTLAATMALALATVILLSSFIQRRLIVGPLAALLDGIVANAEVQAFEPVPVRSPDEIGFLAESFNTMMQRLQVRDAELLDHREHLEEQVRVRSAQLVQMGNDLQQAQKLESIGQLAAGIAHEINTPIQYIGDNLTFLHHTFADILELQPAFQRLLRHLEAAGDGSAAAAAAGEALVKADLAYLQEEIPRAIAQCLDGVGRVSKIVSAMKDFSHPGSETKAPLDLNRAIESTALVCRNAWKYVAEMELDLDPGLPAVPCLAGPFNQVMLNLMINAAHAIEDSLAGAQGVKGWIRVSTRSAGDAAEIRVEDSGGGIPEQIRARIFDPFFTTKPVGKGTGQGLAIAYAVIVQQHGGTLSLESEPGKGAAFIIRLPFS